MNSTNSNSSSQLLIPDVLITTIVAWTGVTFCALSCAVIGRQAFFDFNKLRVCCVVIGIVVLAMEVANALRISDTVSEDTFAVVRSTNLILFIDLLVAITLDLGGRLYFHDTGRINRLYWATVVATALATVMFIVDIILQEIPSTLAAGAAIDHVVRILWPIAVFLAYWYAFNPVITLRAGANADSEMSIVLVGVWYLTGMGFFLLLHSIAVTVAIPFPSQYKELSIIETAIASCTRAALLDFYSFPPSNAIILAMRRYFFPRSLRSKSFFPSNSVPYTSSGHFELGMQSKQSDEVGMV